MDSAITKATTQCGLILDQLGRDALREGSTHPAPSSTVTVSRSESGVFLEHVVRRDIGDQAARATVITNPLIAGIYRIRDIRDMGQIFSALNI